jgi:hypothetical protein
MRATRLSLPPGRRAPLPPCACATAAPESCRPSLHPCVCSQVASVEAGAPLANEWNAYDVCCPLTRPPALAQHLLLHTSCRPFPSLPPQREGDKLRGTNPVEAGVLKKLKEHLLKILPTIHFLELASYILLQETPEGRMNLNQTPVGTDQWTLEFISRIRGLGPVTLRGLGTDYLFDRFAGQPMARASLTSVEVTMLLLRQSAETFRLFAGEESTCIEPVWLALLHYIKGPFVVARDVRHASHLRTPSPRPAHAQPTPSPRPAHAQPTPSPRPAHAQPTPSPHPAHTQPTPSPCPACSQEANLPPSHLYVCAGQGSADCGRQEQD